MLQIHYWERDKQNQSEKVKVIFVPDTRVHLTNLTSYTPYLVTLTAFNTAGDGPPSDPRGARTLQSGRGLSIILLYIFLFSFIPLYYICNPLFLSDSSEPAQLPVLLRGDGRKCQCILGSSADSKWTAGRLQGDLPAHRSYTRYSLHSHTHAHACWMLTRI